MNRSRELEQFRPVIDQCLRCGLCQPVCPVFNHNGNEANGPRGHVAQLAALMAGNLAWADVAPALGTCLLCGLCERACPAQLPLIKIFMTVRRLAPKKLNAAGLQFLAYMRLPGTWIDKLAPALALCQKALEHVKKQNELATPPVTRQPLAMPPQKEQASTSAARRALLYPGCLGRWYFPQMIAASMQTLRLHDYEIAILPKLPCCGRPAAIAGRGEDLLASARRSLEIMARQEFDLLVTPCPGCLATIVKIWPEMHALPPDMRKLAAAIASKAHYITDIIANAPGKKQGQEKIYWHRPCLLGEREDRTSRELLGIGPAGENAARCCGVANELGGDSRNEAGNDLLQHILASGADIVATGCPGCMLELQRIMKRRGCHMAVRHVMEIHMQERKSPKKG